MHDLIETFSLIGIPICHHVIILINKKVHVQKMLITSFWFPSDQQITTLSLARNIKAVRFTSDGQKVHLDILCKEIFINCIMLYGR